MKFVSLSVMMLCGTPNRKMIDLMKFPVVRAIELVIGISSIHSCELVDFYQEVRFASFCRFLEWAYHVESPGGKWP